MYVYSGKPDVVFSFLLPFVLVGAWVDWGWETSTVLTLHLAGGVLFVLSLVDAWKANRCPWRALIAFPAKYVLAVCAVLCSYLAVMGAFSALAGGKSVKHRVGQAATAGAAGYGFMVVRHWIKRLTRPESGIDETVEPSTGDQTERSAG